MHFKGWFMLSFSEIWLLKFKSSFSYNNAILLLLTCLKFGCTFHISDMIIMIDLKLRYHSIFFTFYKVFKVKDDEHVWNEKSTYKSDLGK